MFFSKSWLSQWVHLPVDTAEFQSQLIAKVFEIEHGAKIRILPDDLVLGKVSSVEKHPNADTLFVCQVDCGRHGSYQICTGGENIASWQYVPVALPGCYLPMIDLTIGSRQMRWLDSNGMICSKGEIGINEDEDKHRIWNMWEDLTLDDAMIGKSLKELFPMREDMIFEVESVAITNRPDLRWHFGLAAECKSVFSDYQTSPSKFDTAIQSISQFSLDALEAIPTITYSIDIQTPKVSFYSIIKVENITNDKSTFTGRLWLTDLGHTSKYNWVDYSNRFMETYGQPVHVFDADTVQWNIIVREAKDGEVFIDLTEKEHKLKAGDILICDNEKILALWGVIGGLSSAFSVNTKSILIETANFDPVQIRKTATRLGLRTDASMRFEKAINPLRTAYCSLEQINVVSENHKQYQTGLFTWLVYNKDNLKVTAHNIKLNIDSATVYLQGSDNPSIRSKIQPILVSLGYGVKSINDTALEITPPLRRSDVTIIQDVYEDLARHIGLENIPEIPSAILIKKSEPSFVDFTYQVAELLISSLKFNQVESYPWYSEEWIKLLGATTGKLWAYETNNLVGLKLQNHFQLENPTDETTPYIAQTLLPGLLEIAKKNYRQVMPIKIFEIGKLYLMDEKGTPVEKKVLSALILTKKNDNPKRQEDSYLQLKQILSNISHVFQTHSFDLFASNISRHIEKYTTHPERSPKEYPHPLHNIEYYHPAKQADIMLWNHNDTTQESGKSSHFVWYIAQIHPNVLEEIGIGSEYQASFLEIELQPIFKLTATKSVVGYKSLQDQVITRDLSFEIPSNHHFNLILKTIAEHPQISDYFIFDLYKKDNQKSISITVELLGDGTTTTEQINAIITDIITKVEEIWATLKWAKLQQ